MALVLALLSGGVSAEEPRAGAQRHYRRAVRLYEARRYEAAYEEMERAFALDPVPDLHFNMARVAERLGRPAVAAEHLAAYLRERPEAPDAVDVRARIAVLRAAARGGDERPGGAAGAPERDGGALPGGDVAAPAPGRVPPWPALLLGGAGAVVLLAGVGVSAAAGSAAADAGRLGVPLDSSARRLSVAALVLDLAGAAALGTGLVWTATWWRGRSPGERVSLSLAPAGAGAVLGGRF